MPGERRRCPVDLRPALFPVIFLISNLFKAAAQRQESNISPPPRVIWGVLGEQLQAPVATASSIHHARPRGDPRLLQPVERTTLPSL